jgi:hypothetical protein
MLVSVSSNGEGQLAAGDDRPLPVRAKLRKGAVEGQAVSVAFRLGERPVNVENERLQLDRLPPRRAEKEAAAHAAFGRRVVHSGRLASFNAGQCRRPNR